MVKREARLDARVARDEVGLRRQRAVERADDDDLCQTRRYGDGDDAGEDAHDLAVAVRDQNVLQGPHCVGGPFRIGKRQARLHLDPALLIQVDRQVGRQRLQQRKEQPRGSFKRVAAPLVGLLQFLGDVLLELHAGRFGQVHADDEVMLVVGQVEAPGLRALGLNLLRPIEQHFHGRGRALAIKKVCSFTKCAQIPNVPFA